MFFLFVFLGVGVGVLIWYFRFRAHTPYNYLAQAIRRGEIIPWYQPVICSDTGEIHGVEVLARWRHSGRVILPDVFIPLAEKNCLIIPLTRQLMEQAAIDLRPVINRMRQPFHVAFNLSAAHLQSDASISEDFYQFQSTFPKGSIQLIAEITEREPFSQIPQLNELLLNLHKRGILVALDDFGTGYSNLWYLNELPIDYIKIDRSFVKRISEEDGSDKLVDCVINMAKMLELGIVAEGVETAYQAKWLTAHHVKLLQGYFYSRPLPAADFVRIAVLQKASYFKFEQNSA
ncbi:EAL domain-containing protein [Hafnia alvei]|uniref:EAL domain-containing protein n=1 Tax=Hafnia alvei TaxID=569 RepID=UPI0010350E53|nr:EAL domain-containing protein [Hafnia alvei]TBL45882.1 EAL domain-containing protein [Hafnia alvei]